MARLISVGLKPVGGKGMLDGLKRQVIYGSYFARIST
jgi:hypothetical protein